MKKLATLFICAALTLGCFTTTVNAGILDDNDHAWATVTLKNKNDPTLESEFGPKPTAQRESLIYAAHYRHTGRTDTKITSVKWDEVTCTSKALIEENGLVAVGWVVPYFIMQGKDFQVWWAVFKNNNLVACQSASDNFVMNMSPQTQLIAARAFQSSRMPRGITIWVTQDEAMTPEHYTNWLNSLPKEK